MQLLSFRTLLPIRAHLHLKVRSIRNIAKFVEHIVILQDYVPFSKNTYPFLIHYIVSYAGLPEKKRFQRKVHGVQIVIYITDKFV